MSSRKTNEQRKAITELRISLIHKLTMNGRSISFDDLWNELDRRNVVSEITKESLRGKLYSYDAKTRNGMVSRKPAPVAIPDCVVVDRFKRDSLLDFLYKLLAKFGAKLRSTLA